MKTAEFYIDVLLKRGYTVRYQKGRYQCSFGEKKIEMLYGWEEAKGWHIGEVDNFTRDGQWLKFPIIAEIYFNQELKLQY